MVRCVAVGEGGGRLSLVFDLGLLAARVRVTGG